MSASPSASRLMVVVMALAVAAVATVAPVSARPIGAGRTDAATLRLEPTVRTVDHFSVSKALRRIAAEQAGRGRSGEHLPPPRPGSPPREAIEARGSDTVLQGTAVPSPVPAPDITFEGIKNQDNLTPALPSDANGDIGPNHYVQMVNQATAVFDRQGNVLLGPVDNDVFWHGLPWCGGFGRGDPIVQYDHLADRWLLTQFAFPSEVGGPFYQCLAVSQTPDPTGAYFRYEIEISDTELNDYPKFGVWPDGWYASFNMFDKGALTGARVAAFERDRMLAGDPTARMVSFFIPAAFSLLPSDLDGATPPPAGSPNYFFELRPSLPELWVYEFHVDWVRPVTSTLERTSRVDVAPFSNAVSQVPQPETEQFLSTLSDRLMYRAAYRNFGDRESVVLNHTVDGESGNVGVRWYELRDPGDVPTIHQQGTYAPDSDSRWFGSIAMDRAGNMGVGYSVGSASRFPSIAYTGRLASDPPGDMRQERVMFAGSGSQTGSRRWGDYTSLSVDPRDDCTFWYTNQYYFESSINGWRTRIGSFAFPECRDTADLAVTKDDSPDPVGAGQDLTYSVTVANTGPGEARDVTLTDELPPDTTFRSLISPGGWTCTTPSPGAAGTVRCSTPALAAGAAAVFDLVVRVSSIATGTSISNTAVVSGVTPDPVGGNNSATAETGVVTSADLAISKSATPDPVGSGNTLTYEVTIRNDGPSEARDVSVTDALPADPLPAATTRFESATPSIGGTCTVPAVGDIGVVACSWPGSTGPGETHTVIIVVRALGSGTMTNVATVTSGTDDPDTASNAASVPSVVEPRAVPIDILPKSSSNEINTRLPGVIPVAILSTASFDATSVDFHTVCFGDADDPGQQDCTEAHGRDHVEDVNRDGRSDLLLHYETRETGIDMGDDHACLRGLIRGGVAVRGCDAISTVR